MELYVSVRARQDLAGLPYAAADRVLTKLEWYAAQKDPFSYAKPLAGMSGIYRFRIGAYRAIVSPEGSIISVLRVRKRSEGYR